MTRPHPIAAGLLGALVAALAAILGLSDPVALSIGAGVVLAPLIIARLRGRG
jgi:hypothetical protein